ncbi:MAG: metallophosphoesterase family protein [Chitinophagaceae bacterium]
MKIIGLLSDTHSYIDNKIIAHFNDCDEVWHAGDVGNATVIEALQQTKPVIAVFGNIDGNDVKALAPEWQFFTCEGMKVIITHIGGYPPKYNKKVMPVLKQYRPDIFICGHSHILKIIYDKELQLLHLNPGAAGKQGFQKVRTLLKFTIHNGNIANMRIVELA